jgi:hypothetical protein
LYRHLASEGAIGRGRQAVERSACCKELQECLDCGVRGQPGGIRPEDFSLRNLAASLIVNRSDGQPVGESFIQENFDPRDPHPLQEAMGAVDATAFVGVQGQILINRLLQMYEQEDFVASRMITPTPTVLNGERIPGVARPYDPGEDVTLVREGQEYNTVGFGEEYVETPMTAKHGEIIAITREAVFFDRTGLVLQRAALVGEILGLSKEKRLLQTIIGAVNSYREKRKGDPAPVNLSTYYSAEDNGRWTNHFDGNPLVDYTNLDFAEQQFASIKDPNTGEPIIVGGYGMLAPKAKRRVVEQIVTATQLWRLTQPGALQAPGLGGSTAWPGAITIGGNFVQGMGLSVALSQQLTAQLASGLGVQVSDAINYWFFGNFQKAFAYMENWPITVVQAPVNSEAEFTHDIPFRWKASERGTPAVLDPRFVQRHRAITTSSSSGTPW